MIAVLWCGVHVAQPAFAHDEVAHHQADAAAAGENDHQGAADATHAAHHHCPSALHLNEAALVATACGEALLFAKRTVPLRSLAQAPPLEPPAS